MPKIHWLVYVAIGVFVSVTSYRLDYEKLIFFFYAGWVFVLIGVFKLVFILIKSKTSKKENKSHKVHQTQPIKYCHQCGTALRLHNKFCPRCGARV